MFWIILGIIAVIIFVAFASITHSESEKQHMEKHKKFGKMKKDKFK